MYINLLGASFFIKETNMKINAKYVLSVVALGLTLGVSGANAAPAGAKESVGEIIFKIHDIVPEKNSDGKVMYCNIGATFFNRTQKDVSNLAISLNWNDDVIGEIMDIEEREERERKRNKSKEPQPRYSTSSFTSSDVSVDLKLPPIKVNQQITLKT
jgi:aconitase B